MNIQESMKTRYINNKNDPQKKHRLGTVIFLLVGLNLLYGTNLTLISMWMKANRCLVRVKDP